MPSAVGGKPGQGRTAGTGECRAGHWAGVWAASPGDASSTSRALPGQTSRTLLTPLGSGSKIRVRLSNTFGLEGLRISASSIAEAWSGASVRPETLHRLRFGGRASVTIPAGRQVISDPVNMRAKAFRKLAVSIYVDPDSNLALTRHIGGRQTSYIAPAEAGDQTAVGDGGSFTESTTTRFVVAGVDAFTKSRAGSVVAFGDSITEGSQGNLLLDTGVLAGTDTDESYPAFLARRLEKRKSLRRLNVVNGGMAGNRLLTPGLMPAFGPSALARYRRDVVDIPGARTVIVLLGVNDIGQTSAGAGEIIDGLARLVTGMNRFHLRVLLGTLTPVGFKAGSRYASARANLTRSAVNRWIRHQNASDGIVDFDAAIRDRDRPGFMAARFDSGDHLHPNAAGYRAMASRVPLDDLSPSGCGPRR